MPVYARLAIEGSPEWEYLTNELRQRGAEIGSLHYRGVAGDSQGGKHIFKIPNTPNDRTGYHVIPVSNLPGNSMPLRRII